MSINEEKLKSSMESVKDGLTEAGERLASVAQNIIEALDKMTPEQRMVIEFLAENPEVAETFQELNQKLARQRTIEGTTRETTQPKEPLIKDEKIRKAVRVWAEANELSSGLKVINEHFDSCKIIGRCDSRNVCLEIEFKTTIAHVNKNQFYSIEELCGAPEPLEPSFIDIDERIREKERK